MKPLIIIPVFNEASSLKDVLRDVLNAKLFEIVVVDDGSRDSTSKVAESYNVVVIRNAVNLGKGAALKKGFEYGLKNGYKVMITMDGDGQHKLKDILAIYNDYLRTDSDIVIGNRMWQPSGMPRIRRYTNKLMSWVLTFLTGTKIPDSQCGLKLIRSEILEKINISSNKFEVESEILFQALKKGYKISSVNISSVYFPGRKSHIRPFRDTVRFIRFIFKAVFIV